LLARLKTCKVFTQVARKVLAMNMLNFVLKLAALFQLCNAHSRWVFPPMRPEEAPFYGGVKAGPCGGLGPSSMTTVLKPGWQTLEFEETINHDGTPWRISLGLANGVEEGFEDCILLNHLPHNDAPAQDPSGIKGYKVRVFIPDVKCDHCVLQLMNPMTDKVRPFPSYCLYDEDILEGCGWSSPCPGACFSTYHSCADVSIVGSAPRDTFTCQQPATWPYQEGRTNTPACKHADCRIINEHEYTQVDAVWEEPWLVDPSIPAEFKNPLAREPTVGGQCNWAYGEPGAINAAIANEDRRNLIVNGGGADSGEYPWQAQLGNRDAAGAWEDQCGASIIGQEWIITAAHCFDAVSEGDGAEYEYEDEYYYEDELPGEGGAGGAPAGGVDPNAYTEVALGMHSLYVPIVQAIIHPAYDPATLLNDIALVKVQPLPCDNPNIGAISLMDVGFDFSECTAFVTGTGATDGDATIYPDITFLNEVVTHAFTSEYCNANFPAVNPGIPNTQLCALSQNVVPMEDSCSGDSGGPLKIDAITDPDAHEYVLAGIVSYGNAELCATVGEPGFYTNVAAYKDFIQASFPGAIFKTMTECDKRVSFNEGPAAADTLLPTRYKGSCVYDISGTTQVLAPPVKIDATLCQAQCLGNAGCTAFSYNAQFGIEECTLYSGEHIYFGNDDVYSTCYVKSQPNIIDGAPPTTTFSTTFTPDPTVPPPDNIPTDTPENPIDPDGPVVECSNWDYGIPNSINDPHHGEDRRELIVNGDQTSPNEYPWQVQLGMMYPQEGWEDQCGATLIGREWVISAAHCFDTELDNGDLIKDPNSFEQVALAQHEVYKRVVAAYIHPDYDPYDETISNDIALLRIEPVDCDNDKIKAISLMNPGFLFTECTAFVTGTGALDGADTILPDLGELFEVVTRAFPSEDCNEFFDSDIPETQLCSLTEDVNNLEDSCQGDSGGPLKLDSNPEPDAHEYVLAGIVSYGDAELCATNGEPGYYTDVSYYKQWITSYHPESRWTTMETCDYRNSFNEGPSEGPDGLPILRSKGHCESGQGQVEILQGNLDNMDVFGCHELCKGNNECVAFSYDAEFGVETCALYGGSYRYTGNVDDVYATCYVMDSQQQEVINVDEDSDSGAAGMTAIVAVGIFLAIIAIAAYCYFSRSKDTSDFGGQAIDMAPTPGPQKIMTVSPPTMDYAYNTPPQTSPRQNIPVHAVTVNAPVGQYDQRQFDKVESDSIQYDFQGMWNGTRQGNQNMAY